MTFLIQIRTDPLKIMPLTLFHSAIAYSLSISMLQNERNVKECNELFDNLKLSVFLLNFE